jgi:type IV pilus assembly protein PilC
MAATTQYTYTVRDKSSGKLITDTVEAASEAAVAAELRTRGYTPLNIVPASTGMQKEITFGQKKVKSKDLAIFSRQFATMLNSGLSMLRGLSILSEQSPNPTMCKVIKDIKGEIEKGSQLSAGMSKHPHVFPVLMTNMVKAGEIGGFLDSTMLQIADTLESEVRLKAKIKSAMTYPTAVLVMAVLICIGMLKFIVPTFANMFSSLGGELPLPTKIMVNMSNQMSWFIPVFLVITVGFNIWWKKHKFDENVRNFVDPIKFKLPVFGSLFNKIALARFTRNFSTLLASGVPILTALDIVGDTSGSVLISRATIAVKESVRQGESIAKPLSEHSVFPAMVVQMMAVGEDTGALDQMLAKIAEFYDQEVEATAEQLTALIEPLMIGFLGAIVGSMIVALYMPIFKVFTLIN